MKMTDLKTILEGICAEIKTKKNGHIDFRTTIGRTTKSFIDKMVDHNAVKDPETKVIDKAAAQKPSAKTPTPREITEEVVRRVLDGEVVKSVDGKTQKRKANKNSSLTRAERSRLSQKSADTRSKDKAGVRDSVEKRAKAKAKRDLLNL